MLAEKLNGCVRVRLEIQVPLGVIGSSSVGCDHDQPIIVPEVQQRDSVLGPSRAAGGCQQQHVVLYQSPADAPSRPAVDRRMERREQFDAEVLQIRSDRRLGTRRRFAATPNRS